MRRPTGAASTAWICETLLTGSPRRPARPRHLGHQVPRAVARHFRLAWRLTRLFSFAPHAAPIVCAGAALAGLLFAGLHADFRTPSADLHSPSHQLAVVRDGFFLHLRLRLARARPIGLLLRIGARAGRDRRRGWRGPVGAGCRRHECKGRRHSKVAECAEVPEVVRCQLTTPVPRSTGTTPPSLRRSAPTSPEARARSVQLLKASPLFPPHRIGFTRRQ